jgi:hypothetical protein
MRLSTRGLVPAAALLIACASTSSFGTVLYQDNFNTDTSSAWTVNSAGSNAATFAFDYSSQGIPAAPHSGGSTIGLKLEPNYKGGGAAYAPSVVPGMSLSPIGQSFTGDYTVSADIWFNYPITGAGSTEFGGIGLGSNGAQVEVAGLAKSAYVISSFDGGNSVDYRVYVPSAQSGLTTASVYAAGSRDSANAYYQSAFPTAPTAPAYQTDTTVNPNAKNVGTAGIEYNAAGQLGFAWYTWNLTKTGDTISWSVTTADGLTTTPLASYTLSATDLAGMSGTDILLSTFDGSGSASTFANARDVLFMLVDNVQVTSVSVPEPASLSLLGIGSLALLKRRRNA